MFYMLFYNVEPRLYDAIALIDKYNIKLKPCIV